MNTLISLCVYGLLTLAVVVLLAVWQTFLSTKTEATSRTTEMAKRSMRRLDGKSSCEEAIHGDATIHIRWMIRRDMDEVMAIEEECFGEFAWGEKDFLKCLRQRNCIGMVAEQRDAVVGFMIYELHKSQLFLVNLAVAEDSQGIGVGRAMIAKLAGKLSQHRRTAIALEVRERNLAAQKFFRAMGFEATRVLRERFEDTGEDAYAMRYVLKTPVVVAVDD